MAEEVTDVPTSTDPLASLVNEQDAKIKAHAVLRASEPYLSESKFVQRMTFDFIRGIQACVMMGTRAPHIYDEMLLFRRADDVLQSSIAALLLVDNGFINPVNREVRYVVESTVKALLVDQLNSAKPLDDRIAYLHSNIDPSGIESVSKVTLGALDPAQAKEFADEVTDLFYKQCAYVHPSKRQIEEQITLATAGKSPGFESADELRRVGKLLFRAYDLVLAIFFHGLGLGMAGDLFVALLDDEPTWKFHKGKYVSLISKTFDYKAERVARRT